MTALLLAAVLVGSWNGNWFPSGDSEHRAKPEVEAATIQKAGALFAKAFAELDPAGTNDIILCLNEIRGPRVAAELCRATGRTNLAVAVVSGYRRRDRFDMQQDVIATTLPVAEANWSLWKRKDKTWAPRGYARARLVFSPAVTATVYAVHLKSNYGAKNNAALRAENRRKRSLAIDQLVALEKPPRRKNATMPPVIVAGDFNADCWRPAEFPDETIFTTLAEAGFANPLALLPANARATLPNRKYGDSTLDYVFLRDLAPIALPRIFTATGLSDHSAVFVTVESPER